MPRDRAVKAALNEQFARIGKSLSAPRRLELLDLLAQGERSVEELANETQMSIGLASAHLQSLRRAGLVETRRDRSASSIGSRATTSIASWRRSGRSPAPRLADVQLIAQAHLTSGDGLEAVSRDDLLARVRAGAVTVIDVRPRDEYAAGHIPGALSIPVDELEARLAELPRGTEIVAYCRGPFPASTRRRQSTALHRRGFRARRLEDGFPEWRLAGLPVATGLPQAVAPAGNEGQSLSPETLAAQALGHAEPATGALTPAISPSTTYERELDGSYHEGRVYTRADNPTYEHAERLFAALEERIAPARCSPPAWPRPPRSSNRSCRYLADLHARSGFSTEQLIYAGRAAG